jgi:phytoene desaturase
MSVINKKAIIIGSGVAGMATAIRLAVHGFSVTVYEKNNYTGGKLSSFKQDGFTFDAGPSLFTQPQNLQDLFSFANEPIADYFNYQKIDVACKYFFDDADQINAYTNSELFAAELFEKAGEPVQNVKKYLSRSAKIYDKIGTVFLENSLHKRKTWFNKRLFKTLAAVRLPFLLSSLAAFNRSNFKTDKAQKIFNRFATYNGSNPFKAPAMLSLIPHLEHNEGAFYPQGGMISITNALYKLALNKGVIFCMGSTVQKIIYRDNIATGVVVNNENIFADVIISNMDVYFTYKHLVGDISKAKKVLKQERSSSAIVFYWGVNKSFSQTDLHNILFAENYKAEFDHIFKLKQLYHDPTVYINVTSKMEAAMAPALQENWFVMINVPAGTSYDEKEFIQTARINIIKKINAVFNDDIEKYIVAERVLHPKTMEETTSSYLGSLYGTSSNSKMAAFFRHPNFSKAIKHLYFCGGSVHPGGGIPLCLKSAKIVSDIIVQDQKNKKH